MNEEWPDTVGDMGDERLDGTGRFLSSAELRAWTGLLDTARILDAELERDLVADHAMTHREYEVLVRLDGHGGSMRMTALAAQIEASSPLVSQTVARLEARAWVERRRSEEDGRGVEAYLTVEGSAALRVAAEPHAAIVRALLTDALGADLDQVGEALTRVATHLREHRRGEHCGDAGCPLSPDRE